MAYQDAEMALRMGVGLEDVHQDHDVNAYCKEA